MKLKFEDTPTWFKDNKYMRFLYDYSDYKETIVKDINLGIDLKEILDLYVNGLIEGEYHLEYNHRVRYKFKSMFGFDLPNKYKV